MNVWLVFLGAGLLTFATRLSFILLLGRRPIPLLFSRMLRFIPPAVLAALIFPDVLIREGIVDISPGNGRLLAAVIAALVAWWSRSSVLTILAGMLALWVIQFFGGA